MKLYYLENSVATEDYKYYRNGGDCGGESYDGTGDLKYARFFLDKETAKAYIKDANNWWTEYDFHVKSIEFNELMDLIQQENPLLKTFILDGWK